MFRMITTWSGGTEEGVWEQEESLCQCKGRRGGECGSEGRRRRSVGCVGEAGEGAQISGLADSETPYTRDNRLPSML